MFKQLQNSASGAKPALLTIGNFALVFIAVYCTFNALFSSFEFDLNINRLIFIWLIGAAAVSFMTMFFGSKGIAIFLIPAALLFLWMRSDILEGGGYVIWYITDYYSEWLSITVFFPDYKGFSEHTTVFFSAISITVILLLAFSVCVRRSVFLTVLSTAPIVFLTFVITDLQADIIYLLGLIAVYLTLLISSAINPDNFVKRGLVLIPAFVFAFILMAITYRITPPEDYSREEQVTAMGARLRYITSQLGRLGQLFSPGSGGYFSEFGWLVSHDGNMWLFNTANVDIANAGDRVMTNTGLLEVTVDRPGTFYIRGFSMQNFNGRMWSISDELLRQQSEETARTMPGLIAAQYNVEGLPNGPIRTEMVITRTGDLTPGIIYQPYYRTHYGGFNRQLSTERFFHVERSIHRLNESLDSVVIVINNLTNNELLQMMEDFPVFIHGNRGGGVFEFSLDIFGSLDIINSSSVTIVTDGEFNAVQDDELSNPYSSAFDYFMEEVSYEITFKKYFNYDFCIVNDSFIYKLCTSRII